MPDTTTYDLTGCACCTTGFCGCTDVPATLTATFTNVSCDSGYSGATATLTWNGSYYHFEGTINGKDHEFDLSCLNSATHQVRVTSPTGPECSMSATDATATCSPFDVTFSGVTLTTILGGGCGCVTGQVDIHVTE